MLIVGLGNPGSQYENTYHNMGFMVADKLADKLSLRFKDGGCQALVAEGNIGGKKVLIAKPQTYMNASGESVKALMVKYKLEPKDVIIAYDDIDLPVGSLRVREKGSAGTHNGMRSVVSLCGELPRVRVGIGKPHEGQELFNFVLAKLSSSNAEIISKSINKAVMALEKYIDNGDIAALARELN